MHYSSSTKQMSTRRKSPCANSYAQMWLPSSPLWWGWNGLNYERYDVGTFPPSQNAKVSVYLWKFNLAFHSITNSKHQGQTGKHTFEEVYIPQFISLQIKWNKQLITNIFHTKYQFVNVIITNWIITVSWSILNELSVNEKINMLMVWCVHHLLHTVVWTS